MVYKILSYISVPHKILLIICT